MMGATRRKRMCDVCKGKKNKILHVECVGGRRRVTCLLCKGTGYIG